MNLTEGQLDIIFKYTDDRYINQCKLIEYLDSHDIISEEVFNFSSKYDRSKGINGIEYGYDIGLTLAFYKPLDRDTFIRRIPFFYYIPDESPLGKRISRLVKTGLSDADQKQYYSDLEFLFYDLHMTPRAIFSYPADQADTPIKLDPAIGPMLGACIVSSTKFAYDSIRMFPQWIDYIHICQKLGWKDYMPKRFITAYNTALEAAGREPIIYKPFSEYDHNYFHRENLEYKCYGAFPCDDDGVPILRWTNIHVEHPAYIRFTAEKSLNGTLSIGLTPTTTIHCKGQANESLYGEEIDPNEWYQIYSGPLTMEFDYEALRDCRKQSGLTQKDIAEAIGVTDRTYQNWEYGETIPDGYHLLRIMNWLQIENLDYLIKYKDPSHLDSH